jgi:hypothetical protein
MNRLGPAWDVLALELLLCEIYFVGRKVLQPDHPA